MRSMSDSLAILELAGPLQGPLAQPKEIWLSFFWEICHVTYTRLEKEKQTLVGHHGHQYTGRGEDPRRNDGAVAQLSL